MKGGFQKPWLVEPHVYVVFWGPTLAYEVLLSKQVPPYMW